MYQCSDCAKVFDENNLDDNRLFCDECNGRLDIAEIQKNDEELSRQYVERVFLVGREICSIISKSIHMNIKDEVKFTVDDENSLEISLSILGTSFVVLKGYSQVMTVERGVEVERYSKLSLEKDYDLPSDTIRKLYDSIDHYQDAFRNGISNKKNPFPEVTKMMLSRCLGSDISTLYLPKPENDIFNPIILDLVNDIMVITITRTMEFWKGS